MQRSPKSSLALIAALALAPTAAANDGVFIEQNGLVVIHMESAVAPSSWTESVATPGYTGSAYLRWDGANQFAAPDPAATFGFNFELTTPGNYWVNLRNRHEHPNPTEENDVWARMDGGTWWKLFSNGPQSVGGWSWESRYEDPGHTYPQLSYSLSAGLHRIEFSARSAGFKMDRLHLAIFGQPDQYNETLPESPARVGTMYGNQNNNSTGTPGLIEAWGSTVVADNNLRLEGYRLPQGAIGFFIVSDTQMFFANPGGSSGNVLVGPSIGRYAGNVLVANAQGRVAMNANLTQIPRPNGPVAAVAGQTWNFQFWHRDTNNGQPTSNFTRGLTVSFD